MTSQVFVPVTDDIIFNHPEQIEGPLVPYFAGMECHHWLSIEINPEDDIEIENKKPQSSKRTAAQSGLRLAYSNV